MSNNHKNYDYFKVEGPAVKTVIDGYKAISTQRHAVILQATKDVGAVAYIVNSGFGEKGDKITGFAWAKDYEFPCLMTIKDSQIYDGKPVVSGRGKGNTTAGREFNRKLDAVIKEANAKLVTLPCWQSYIIKHYCVMHTGFGEMASRGFGISMLTTYGGKHPTQDDCLLFAIPNNKGELEGENRHGTVSIPPEFQPLTYGQFYDLTNTKADE